MSDNVTDRIANVVGSHVPDMSHGGQVYGGCDCGADIKGCDWRFHVADAVIEELGLHEELGWFITTATFKSGGRVIAGPFATSEDARDMREAMERRTGHYDYWIDSKPVAVWLDAKSVT